VDLLRRGRTGSLGGLPSGRLAPSTVAPETCSHAQDDTGAVELDEKERVRRTARVAPLPDLTLSHQGIWLQLGLLVGLVALVAGLAGGVIAFLLWGPRVG
jgi:hypothetical protein